MSEANCFVVLGHEQGGGQGGDYVEVMLRMGWSESSDRGSSISPVPHPILYDPLCYSSSGTARCGLGANLAKDARVALQLAAAERITSIPGYADAREDLPVDAQDEPRLLFSQAQAVLRMGRAAQQCALIRLTVGLMILPHGWPKLMAGVTATPNSR